MKLISVVNSDKSFDNDYIFSRTEEHDLLYPMWYLKDNLSKCDIDIHTSDILPKEKADFIIYNEAPKKRLFRSRDLPKENEKDKSYLMALECPIIRPSNYNIAIHSKFSKVLTWNDDLVASDPVTYIKSNFVNNIRQVNFANISRTEFLVCIAGNKKVKADNELYSERRKIIEWFDSQNSDEFDLYGAGWGHYKVDSDSWLRPLNRVFRYLPSNRNKFRSWKGVAGIKTEVLSRYKFNLCFENAQKYPGYITEKIFDSFFAGTIPIYWGASNIEKYIPSDCYIDYRKFSDISDCYVFLKTITDEQLVEYQLAMQRFLDSQECYDYSMPAFVDTFLNRVL